jgi:hypothetical protein
MTPSFIRFIFSVGLLVLLSAKVGLVAAQGVTVSCETPSISAQAIEPFKFNLATPKATDVTVRVFNSDGDFVRVLLGEAMPDNGKAAFEWDKKDSDGRPVRPGVFTVRTDSGFSLKLDKSFAKDGVLAGPPFVNPKSIYVDRKGDLFVLDVPKSTLYKYHANGSPADDWDKSNKITSPTAPLFASVAVSDSGRIYMPLGYAGHSLGVYDGKTGKAEFEIGNFFNDDLEWKIKPGGLGWPSFAVVGNGRVYIACPGYNLIGAFDQNRPASEGAYWRNGPNANKFDSVGNAGDTDGRNGLYLSSAPWHGGSQLFKLVDNGDICTFAYDMRRFQHPVSHTDEPLNGMSGITSDRRGVLLVVMRPTQSIVKVVDTGSKFVVVAAVGSKGQDAEKMQFMGPAAIALNPAGDAVYVSEDNEPMALDSEVLGLARVTKYTVDETTSELKITVSP